MHTDRGAQYTSHAFRDRCLANGVIPSVGRTGTCYDNAAAESFNATIKKERIHEHRGGCRRGPVCGIRLHRAVLQPRPETVPPGKLSPLRFEESIDIPDVNADHGNLSNKVKDSSAKQVG